MRRALALGVAATALVAAAPAQATLVYTKNLGSIKYKPSVWAANDDGSARHRLATGFHPRISPDGTTVAYTSEVRTGTSFRYQLNVVAAVGGAPRALIKRLNDPFALRWSPDSTKLLAVAGPERGPYRLTLVDVASGVTRTIDQGSSMFGASFSPDGQQLVYSRVVGSANAYPPRGELFRADVSGGQPTRLTKGGRSFYPLWGPQGLVYSQARQRKQDAPVYQLHRLAPDGSGDSVITHTKVGRLVSGLTATEFSADGSRLLAQFGGQDTSYAVAVNPATGKERVLGPKGEQGDYATRISKDGKTVLAADGGFDPGNRGDVITRAYAGGKSTVLVPNADDPDWNR